MKNILTIIFSILAIVVSAQESLIVGHLSIDLNAIPANWIDSAKANLYIGYGHTSHGSQLISGMNAIEGYFNEGRYSWSHSKETGKLHLFEGSGYDDGYLHHDCGYEGWDELSREYLNDFPACNVIIWSWCGQVDNVDVQNHYIDKMVQLEKDYPQVTFVYMTGHLEGEGPEGDLFKANQKIRDHCNLNNKVLFDFTDIEKYDPGNETNFQQYYVTDECYYNHPDGGSVNWANDWLNANPDHILSKISNKCGSCAHSVSLNCVKKGVAAWHLWAQIAGWDPTATSSSFTLRNNFIKAYPVPFKDKVHVVFPELVDLRKTVHISIVDASGIEVYKESHSHILDKISIPTSGFANGIYILSAQTNNQQLKRVKIVK